MKKKCVTEKDKIVELKVKRIKELNIYVKVNPKIIDWIKERSEVMYTHNYFGNKKVKSLPFLRFKEGERSNWLMTDYYNSINSPVFTRNLMNLAILRIPGAENGINIRTIQMVGDSEVRKSIKYFLKACREIYERIAKNVDIEIELNDG